MNDSYEEFTESQTKSLERYVTSITSPIFALRNLPEVIKGALFSRYSRSSLGLGSSSSKNSSTTMMKLALNLLWVRVRLQKRPKSRPPLSNAHRISMTAFWMVMAMIP